MLYEVITVHLVTAHDFLPGKLGEGQNALVAAPGDADHPFVLDIEIERLFASHPDHDGQIKGDQRAPFVKLVDVSGPALDQLAPVGNRVLGIGRGKLRPAQEPVAL